MEKKYDLSFLCSGTTVITNPTQIIRTEFAGTRTVNTRSTRVFSKKTGVVLVTQQNLSEGNKTDSDSKTTTYIAVGVIAGVIVIFAIVLLARLFRKKSKPDNLVAPMVSYSSSIVNNATNSPPQDMLENTTNGEMVVNELHVSAGMNKQ